MSGLNINFHKSKLATIVVDLSTTSRFASLLHCKLMTIPFVYLRIIVGSRTHFSSTWDLFLQKMRDKLNPWRRKQISFGGRVCLIQSVLSSLPLFFLFYFKIPVGVEKECRKIMCNFLWGGLADEQKISWVSWEQICKPKDLGGLGLKDWLTSNKALVGKWKWRYLSEPNSLWC